MADKKNIIVGAARFWVGTAAAVKPAPVAATSYNVTLAATTGWRDVGYTQEGVEFSNEPDFSDVEVDQLMDSARTYKSGQKNMIKTTFAEATLENLLVVWGQQTATISSTTSSTTLSVVSGDLGQAPLEVQLFIVGNGKEDVATGYFNERSYYFSRAVSTDNSSIAQRRNENQAISVSFRLLPDSIGTYGTFFDRTRTANWANNT